MRVLLLLLALLQGILSVAAPTDDKTRQWEKRQTTGAAEAEQLFIEALKLTGYEIPAGTNLTDLATRLVHFNGCSSGQKKDIYEGWQDSWKMMDEVNEASKIDFNTGAAIDYLGPPLHIVEYQDVIRDEPPLSCILLNHATIKAGWFENLFQWRIHIRCDDPLGWCPCGSNTETVAYTTSRDPDSGLARINFCPSYFARLGLDELVTKVADHPDWDVRGDLTGYQENKGSTWYHELLHIDWVHRSGAYGNNQQMVDLMISWREGQRVRFKDVYGAELCKVLARGLIVDAGWWIAKSTDSLAMFALARYVQKKLGNNYPHLPIAEKRNGFRVMEPSSVLVAGDMVSVQDDGTTTVINPHALPDPLKEQCVAAETNNDNAVEIKGAFLGASSYPAAYVEEYRKWLAAAEAPRKFSGKAIGLPVKPGTKLRILGVGDSITVGFLSGQDGGDGNGYRAKLLENLSKDNVEFVGTESTGSMSGGNFAAWSGKTIQYISDNVGPSLAQRPNIILVHAGTNDMNPNLGVAKEGNDPKGAADRLGKLIDKMIEACPDATILVAMIISTCSAAQQPATAQYQALIPEVVRQRWAVGKKVLAVDFTSFPMSSLRDCIHPTNAGYRQFGDYWSDFIAKIPRSWIREPIGKSPEQPSVPGIEANGGLNKNIPSPNWGSNPVQASSKAAVKAAAAKAGNGGKRTCNGLPVWEGTGKIALGLGSKGDWQYRRNWVQAGKVADGIGRDWKNVRLHDMNGDGKADYVWIEPKTGQIRCWINNLPNPWSPAVPGTGDIIGSGAGAGESVFLADMNGDGKDDYLVVNPNNGAVSVYWNYGRDSSWVNGWKFVPGGQIASGVPHANWATLRFPDINGDGRADYVYIGEGGALAHWLNTGSAGGQDVLFVAQGGIATGATSNIGSIVFSDMNGDGRDDYLLWDAQAGLTGFLNQPTRREGVPLYINQGAAKTIAEGITQDPSKIILADMDGDGKDDYNYIDQNGAIWLWYNRGSTNDVMPIDGLRFADIDGDGLDDYITLHPDTGAPTVYVNKGPNDGDSLGWLWSPLNGGKPIASGAAPAHKVKFGDINGDGKDDYLVVDSVTGELTAYLNEGQDTSRPEGWRWNPIGSIATGLGPGANVRFADIDGDGFDDYILLHANGGTTIYRNVWATNKPPVSWRAMPDADASGIGQRPEEIQFVDINGDGKADYVWTKPHSGAARVWLNNYPNKPTWLEQPEIAGGVGISGSDVRYAVLQETGRASYLAVDRTNGAIAAWLNGCNNLAPKPPAKVVLFAIFELYTGSAWVRTWLVFETPSGKQVDACGGKPIKSVPAQTTLADPDYPTKIEDFKAHGISGCSYAGAKDAPGELVCPGVRGAKCSQDAAHDDSFDCGSGGNIKPVVSCEW